jgi:hypothetical protein
VKNAFFKRDLSNFVKRAPLKGKKKEKKVRKCLACPFH